MLPFCAGERRALDKARVHSSRGEVTFPSKMRSVEFFLSLFVPQPPELCKDYGWLITLITLSSFVGECCDWVEMRLIRYQ